MLVQNKNDNDFKVEVISLNVNSFRGKVIQDKSGKWKEGEISNSFSSKSFEAVFDLAKIIEIREFIKQAKAAFKF